MAAGAGGLPRTEVKAAVSTQASRVEDYLPCM